MRYASELVHSSDGFLAVAEKYVVIENPREETIGRVKICGIASDLLGGLWAQSCVINQVINVKSKSQPKTINRSKQMCRSTTMLPT
ncbi:hypothetical protein Hdeb2414_s0007g00226901 [Helianthus debilis subsp. tardiflorus]